jgi:hypothetical protein
MQLTIDIGFRHMIEIKQGKFTDTTSYKRFHSPGSHTSHADHSHMGIEEFFQGLPPVEAGNSTKTSLNVQTLNTLDY